MKNKAQTISPVRFWTVLVAQFALVFLASCDQSAQVDPVPKKEPEEAVAPAEQRKVVVLTWEEYFAPEVIEQFEKETGILVQFEHYESTLEMKALVQSSPDAYDLVVTDGGSVMELRQLQLVGELNKAKIPHFENLDSRYLDLDFDPGNKHSVPYMWGTTLLAYRSDKIDSPERSWNVLWNEDVKGHVVMLNEENDTYSLALLAMGLPMNTSDPEHLNAATEKLLTQVRDLDATYDDIISARHLIQEGECWIFVAYSGDAAIIAADDENIDYFIPREGAPLWVDSFVFTRESQNREEAHAFLDFMAKAEVAAENSNYLWYATANKAALPLLNEELISDERIYPPADILEKCQFIKWFDPVRSRIINLGMKQILDEDRAQQAQAAK